MAKEKVVSKKIILVGGSAGSLEIVFSIASALGKNCEIPIVFVIHRLRTSGEGLKDIIAHKTDLRVREPNDKEAIENGTIYLAPADYHLLIEKDGTFSLDYSEKINFSRPSINPTFETAAMCYKKNAVAILLSGANSDGVNGLEAICKFGGQVIIQDPRTAQTPFMPEQALDSISGAIILPPKGIIKFITDMSCTKK